MLQALRKQASNWIIKILLGLLIMAFAIWGINDVFLGERDPAVAKVGGIKIPRSQHERALRDEMNRLRPVFGGRLDREAALRMGLADEVLNRLINRAAISLSIRDLGIAVTDEMINKHIRTQKQFLDSQGRFNRQQFFRALAVANISEGYYVTNLRERLATEQINQAITRNIPVPTVLVGAVTKFRSEQRTATTLLVPFEPLGKAREPRADELENYYKANKARFMAPEFKDLTFIHLDPDVLAKEISVPEKQIKTAYEERKEEFTRPARRKISQVVFKTKGDAEAVSAAVKAGKSLAQAAKEKDKTLKVVKLGWVEGKDLFSELTKPVFALKKGDTSAPLKTAAGWHVVTVEDLEKRIEKPFSEVRNTLRQDIARSQAIEDISRSVTDLEDNLAGGASIRSTASNLNVKAHRVTIDGRGRGQSGKAIKSLPKDSDFLRTVSETQEGETSQLGETQGDGFYILIVNKVIAPALKPLDQVRDLAKLLWKAERQSKATAKRAKSILERIKKGDKLAAIAKAERLEIKKSPPFTRLTHEAESGVPGALAEKLSALKSGEAAMAESEKGYVVGILTSISPAVGKQKSDIRKASVEEIRSGMASDLIDQLVDAFRKRTSITTYPDILKDRI
jgi:peptidyl-prolyl cis-trans isomerase D